MDQTEHMVHLDHIGVKMKSNMFWILSQNPKEMTFMYNELFSLGICFIINEGGSTACEQNTTRIKEYYEK